MCLDKMTDYCHTPLMSFPAHSTLALLTISPEYSFTFSCLVLTRPELTCPLLTAQYS